MTPQRATAPLGPRVVALKDATDWLDTYRAFWEDGIDRMDQRLRDDG